MSDLEQKWNDEYKNFMLRFYPESTPFIYTWEIYKTAKRESHVKIRELLELVEILNQIRDNLQDSTKELQERIASQQNTIEEHTDLNAKIKERDELIKTGLLYMQEAHNKFTPHITNSLALDWIEKAKQLTGGGR